MVQAGDYATVLINRLSDAEEELVEVHKKYEMVETFEVKAKSKAEVIEAEITHLKMVLKKVEANLASKKKGGWRHRLKSSMLKRRLRIRLSKSDV